MSRNDCVAERVPRWVSSWAGLSHPPPAPSLPHCPERGLSPPRGLSPLTDATKTRGPVGQNNPRVQGAGPDLGQPSGIWDEAALLAVAVFCVHLPRLPRGQVPKSRCLLQESVAVIRVYFSLFPFPAYARERGLRFGGGKKGEPHLVFLKVLLS